jgi:hypothetical protein
MPDGTTARAVLQLAARHGVAELTAPARASGPRAVNLMNG